MVTVIILLFTLVAFFSNFEYLTQTISSPSFLASAQAQEGPHKDNIDLNGIWERSDKVQVNITQTGSEVIARGLSPTNCQHGVLNQDYDPYLEFKGTIDGNQIIGKESSWCYSGSPNPDENGLFIEPFQSTISDDGKQLTEFITSRFTGEKVSVSYSKISGPAGVVASPAHNQASSTTDQLRDTFTSTLSQVKESLASLQANDLPRLLLLAGLGVAAIGGTAVYAKHRSSKKLHQEEEQANIEVITRGGIE